MMDIAIRAAVRPGQRRLVYLCAILAGVAAGLVIGLDAGVPGRIPADARVVTVTRYSTWFRPEPTGHRRSSRGSLVGDAAVRR
jgi:hypothetical protein